MSSVTGGRIKTRLVARLVRFCTIAYTTTISLPSAIRKKDTKKELEIKRQKFRRRAAIEPVIAHLKSDHRMARNFLKGFRGDEVNLLMAASVFNLKKWIRIYFFALYLGDYLLMKVATVRIGVLLKSQMH